MSHRRTADLPSRRGFLSAVPVLGLAAACSSRPEQDSPGVPPRPAVPGSADEALQALVEGNARFTSLQPLVRNTADIEVVMTEAAAGQAPFATVLGCADSRLAPELIFDQFLGDIFVVREAGNLAESPTNLGSLEFGQAVLGSKCLVVLGHSSCGAVKAAMEGATPGGNIQAVVDAIAPGIAGARDLVDATKRNVAAVITRIRAKSPLLQKAEAGGAIRIVGAYYDIDSGGVEFL